MRKTRARHDWHDKFIEGLKVCANIRMACERAHITRDGAYKAKMSNPEFSARWDEAIDEACDGLEKEAWRRALRGVVRTEPIMYQGKPVARKVIREYSDRLMELLLRSNRPAKFREQIKVITESEADQAIENAILTHNLPAGTIDATEQNT